MPNPSVEESKYLYFGLASKVIRFDTLSESIAKEIRFPLSVVDLVFRSAVFHPPNQLVVGMTDGSLVAFDVWNGTTVSRSQKSHSAAVTDLQVELLTSTLITISDDKSLKVWNLDNLSAPLRSVTFGTPSYLPYSLCLAGGNVFVGTKQDRILMLSLSNLLAGGNDILYRFNHGTSVTALRVLEGTLLAVSGDKVFLWSISDRTQLGCIEPNCGFINAMEITDNRIFVGANDNCIHMFRYQTRLVTKVKDAARRKEKDLDISYCQLTDFPTILGYAKWITSLNLSFNAFTFLPHAISHMHLLTTLTLSHNSLDSLPDELATLTSLTTLQLDNNRFKMVPLPLASLPFIKTLNLAHNNLSFLLPFLVKLPLTVLDVSNNPMEDPPPDVVKSGFNAIMDYLRGKASQAPMTVNRVKVMLVGNENVGKTSLVMNLRHKAKLFNARPNIKTLSTQGISIETVQAKGAVAPPSPMSGPSSPQQPKLTMSVPSTPSGSSKDKKKDAKRKVKWYTWDFGGQEVYYHTHQFFITPHSIYIIAFNVTKPLDENNILFWLRCIRARTSTSRGSHSYSGDSTANKSPVPVILVGTHTDAFEKAQLPWLNDLFLDNSKEKIALQTKKDDAFLEVYFSWIFKKFSVEHPSILLVTGVSSKTGKGVKELKMSLRSTIDTSPAIRNQVNSIVYERVFLFEQIILRAKAAKMPPFLTWSEYQTLALGCIDDQSHLLEATKLLANLGSLVYLPSSSRKNSWMVSMAQLFPEDYENAPTSAEFVVLDPQWLVDLFATILGTSPNFVRNGMIRSQDLTQIWKDQAKYPPHLHAQLMMILEYFDVAFALGSKRKDFIETNPIISGLPAPKLRDISRTQQQTAAQQRQQRAAAAAAISVSSTAISNAPTHLFPSLLPTAKPQLDILWPSYEHRFQVDRIYTFPNFLPLGLFSRFMVRLLSYFPAFYYWRQGIIISDDTKRAYALLEEIPNLKQVVITVRGPVNAVSQFLTSVMDIWGKLVADMYDISFQMTTTCYHCTASRIDNPHIFELSMCEVLVVSGERFTMCGHGGVVRLDQLCPDLCLVNIRALEINPAELLPWGSDPADGGVVGEGGFGIVYRKSYKGKKVAVKRFKEIEKRGLLPAELAKIHTSFRNEIWLMSGVTHPNIVQLIGFSLRRESIMVMEYISGGDLYEALISNKKLDWPLRCRIALDIARGMAALHALNPPLCHSDLKCPNCMIVEWSATAPIVSKVSDFGLSSRLYGDQLTKTPTTNPFWTAPEILAQLPFDTSADVYSFGVILWNLLSRKALFEEMLPWTDEVSRAVRAGKRPTIPKEPGMPPEYEALICKCWDHKPANRPRFVDVCLELENMIQTQCPEIYPIVVQSRAEMISANPEHQDFKSSLLLHSSGIGGSFAFGTRGGSGFLTNDFGPSTSASSSLSTSSSQSSFVPHELIRTSTITNTWVQLPTGKMGTHGNKQDQLPPTYYNNSKLADYGTMLLKQLSLGSVISRMTVVGLSQVWAYSPTMGLIYVINSVSGQFVKSFVAPKDLSCLIEVNFREGSSEVWGAGKSGLHIWHGDTAQPLSHTPSKSSISSLLYIFKPDRRAVVWAGLSESPHIQVWSAVTHDLLRVMKLEVPENEKSILAPIPAQVASSAESSGIVKLHTPQVPYSPVHTTSSSHPIPSAAPSSSSTAAASASSPSSTADPVGSTSAVAATQQAPSTVANPSAPPASSSFSLTSLLASILPGQSSSKSHTSPKTDITPTAPITTATGPSGSGPRSVPAASSSSSAAAAAAAQSSTSSSPTAAASTLALSNAPNTPSSTTPAPSESHLKRSSSSKHPRRSSSSTASSPRGYYVSAMIRTPDSIWVSIGPFILRLNKNTGAPLDAPSSNAVAPAASILLGPNEADETELITDSNPLPTKSETGSPTSPTSLSPTPPSPASQSPAPKHVLLAHAGGTHSLVYAGLQTVWSTGSDGSVKIWDSSSGALLKTISNYSPLQLLVIDRTQLWAVPPFGTSVDVWNLESREMVSRIDTRHTAPVNHTMLVFNKTIWTAAQDETIHVFT